MRKANFKLSETPPHMVHKDRDGIQKERARDRTGTFHQWGGRTEYDGENTFQTTFAIIEEDETGQIYEVAPAFVQFELKSESQKFFENSER